ncbi:hypothetical protein INT43_003758 [Umbelopsis isabellina]|uniref:alpha-1,2-Mannosidase n=1 Tax=Mortierella isabellina TaxID=91625 RepID=A0A8H7PVI2_MORIS|nr:hypothetical protein INT43_003758 [Umbelopsis isabellina]
MKQGKTVYDDDDKYSKHDKPWSLRKAWRQKPIFRYTIISAIFISIILLYVYGSNPAEKIERWEKNGGVYNAGNDPQAVRDDKNNEVIPVTTTVTQEENGGLHKVEDISNKVAEDEEDYAKVKALMDLEAEKLRISGARRGKYLFTQNPPPANLYDSDTKWAERQEKVRQAFKHAWKGYSNDCFGMDEYQPLSHTGHDWSPGGIGLMILDSLDTIMLMNLEEEYAQVREWVEKKLSFDKHQDVNLFETTIRVLGGLLSAYHLSGNDKLYLEKAVDLGDRLLGAFDSDSGIPYAGVILSTGLAHKVSYISSSTAEVTTVQMEFKYLSHLTGDKKYWDKAERVMKHIHHLIDTDHSLDGLVPIMIDPNSGNFAGAEIRLGSRGDSYYEYLLKQYLQTGKSEPIYRQMYDQATDAMKKYLIGHSYPSNYLYLGELPEGKNNPSNLSPKMDHLVCFIGGSFALGATEGPSLSKTTKMMSDRDNYDIKLGQEITRSCYEMYNSTATGLASEIVYFNTKSNNVQGSNQDSHEKDIIIQPRDTHNILRPETVESLFLLWRITGDDKYRDWGWKIFEAFEEHTKLPNGGYAALRDVTVVPPPQDNRMDTFFLAETLKYLYLLFGPEDILPLDKYIFNTEAHPLPVFTPRW